MFYVSVDLNLLNPIICAFIQAGVRFYSNYNTSTPFHYTIPLHYYTTPLYYTSTLFHSILLSFAIRIVCLLHFVTPEITIVVIPMVMGRATYAIYA